jgi:hypothetical protein
VGVLIEESPFLYAAPCRIDVWIPCTANLGSRRGLHAKSSHEFPASSEVSPVITGSIGGDHSHKHVWCTRGVCWCVLCRLGTCPYYGTRHAVAQAEVIAMPYTVLLQREVRLT